MPVVAGTNVIFPSKRFSGVVYCRMLLHDTMLNNDSYRTGTADTPISDCGHALETTEHFLLYCNRYEKERKDMFDFIYHCGIITKQNQSSIITEALLLSPSCDKSVNSRYNRIVKEALFEFLDKVNLAIHTPYWRRLYRYTYDELYCYTMKTSLQQQESFVIRVGLSP